ncbi:fatty acyl-CoA reductase 1 [Patella vulgata]|uniref:fatty acyl-CoA reductase 1 n=1 Tax=Patella vulgata TaxID=6465 RepID=UPI00217F5C66|nr:fatty acyl-CoA reductase 1 [Patella vulgata]
MTGTTSEMGISEFYAGQTLLITGCTGFMGKVLLEKLLRSCPEIERIYVLIRSKRGQSATERLETLLKSKLFDKVRNETINIQSKIVPVCGDIVEEKLGLSDEDIQTLSQQVSVVFHSAATVKFDEELRLSLQMNVIGVKSLIELCHKFKKLKALIHVSTAYANCDKNVIEEKVYDPPLNPNRLIDAAEWMDNDAMNSLTAKLLGNRPNTYTYTKAMAEYLILQECGDLPVAIVRPSIVGSSWKEPFPGWVDNYNGPTGLLVAIGKGVLRCMMGNFNGTADILPVDIATNLMITVGWHTAVNKPEKLMVYNNTTGQLNKFTWGQMERFSYEYFMKNPIDEIARVPNPRFTKYLLWKDLNVIFDHLLPAYVMDFYLWIVGRKPIFVKIQDKLWKAVKSLEFFTSHEWKFANDNINMLAEHMTAKDREIFDFDVRKIRWGQYMENYCLGTKQFVLKENPQHLPKARRALQKLQRMHFLMNAVVFMVVWRLLINRVSVAKSLWNLLIGWALFIFQKIPKLARST